MNSSGYAPRKQRSATTEHSIQEGLKCVNHNLQILVVTDSLREINKFIPTLQALRLMSINSKRPFS